MKQVIILLIVMLGMNTSNQAQTKPKATAKKTTTTAKAAPPKYEWKEGTSGGYKYSYVTNDPMGARFYTLSNGLRVILSVNKKEPRIQTLIPVKAGSNNDPATHTGLAHYLEHLLFKGTDKYGSLDWSKEKPLLDQIEALYEKYNSTTDAEQRKAIYKEIDQVSGEAAKFAIAQEYDKMMTDMGAQGTNAHTWFDETVYKEDIPSTAVDKFLTVQAERFRNPIFRIFHTELEAVYEEKNRSLDNDGSKVWEVLLANIFPKSNYGQQTTIGTVEHLKNPSLVEIRKYYEKYYVPNNMAVIMAGDFNPDYVIQKVDQLFGKKQNKPVTDYATPVEPAITAPIFKEVWGPTPDRVQIGYRTAGATTRQAKIADLISSILSNGSAGLIDLDLNQTQKVLGAGAGVMQLKDYGVFNLFASPKEGQTLEQVRDLLLQEIDKVKMGLFDDVLLKSIINNAKKQKLEGLDDNGNRAYSLMSNFINRNDWRNEVNYIDEMSKITKEEIVETAKQLFGNNYVCIYKRKGEDKSIQKVEKPAITPIETNPTAKSDFVNMVNSMPENSVKPVFVDYTKDFQKGKVGSADVYYVKNKDNGLFRLYYRLDMGKFNSKLISIAGDYLDLLGTSKYSAEQLKKEFYALASSYSINVGNEETSIVLDGLNENFDKSIKLLEHLLADCKADEKALTELKGRIKKSRSNAKANKGAILSGLQSYALYGAKNPFNNVLSTEELNNLKSSELINLIHSLTSFKHDVIYYGPKDLAALSTGLKAAHKVPAAFKPYPAASKFMPMDTKGKEVLFADYDMVQAEIRWARNSLFGYNPELQPSLNLFNKYFGGGMGGLVFSTIRESKALAYSTFATVSTPYKKDESYQTIGYVGCQADKMKDAIDGLNDLFNNLPNVENNIESAKLNLKKDIETDRISKENIVFNYLSAKRRGINYDIRQKVYEKLPTLGYNDLKSLHSTMMAGRPFTYCVVGSEKKLDMDVLAKFGKINKLTLDEIFGYTSEPTTTKP